ncbi:cobalamin B12-binding domain-containing protein [Paenibacillus turpanensis]|uniref:cobalamin B12-binding domain-containing protein n=1 Tax=Paenibacillus turpanensis TaxID=2689078 RepID=UPI00140C1CB8|nr:cobalamin-dependent protein [Paenibacillus turpanensis]
MQPIESFTELLLNGDQTAAWEAITENREAGKNSLFIYERLLGHSMKYIGQLWEHNLISVADEHLASATCDITLTRYSSQMTKPPKPNAPKAMLLCLEGEEHYLGLKMVACYLREEGWDVRFYGPNLPLEFALIGAMNWKPDMIGISTSIVYHLPKLAEYVETFEALHHQPLVMVGGRLVNKYDLRPYCSDKTALIGDLLELTYWLPEFYQKRSAALKKTTG